MLSLSYSDRCPIRALRRTRQKKATGETRASGFAALHGWNGSNGRSTHQSIGKTRAKCAHRSGETSEDRLKHTSRVATEGPRALAAPQELIKSARSSPLRVQMVAGAKLLQKGDKVTRKHFNNVLGHVDTYVCTQPQALNGTKRDICQPHFGVQNLDDCHNFSAPARFPKTFLLASRWSFVDMVGWLSPFCLAVTLIAAASFAFLRTGKAPCSASFCRGSTLFFFATSLARSFCFVCRACFLVLGVWPSGLVRLRLGSRQFND